MQQQEPERQLKRMPSLGDAMTLIGPFVFSAGVLGSSAAIGGNYSAVGGLVLALIGMVMLIGGRVLYRLETIHRDLIYLLKQNSGRDHDT